MQRQGHVLLGYGVCELGTKSLDSNGPNPIIPEPAHALYHMPAKQEASSLANFVSP